MTGRESETAEVRVNSVTHITDCRFYLVAVVQSRKATNRNKAVQALQHSHSMANLLGPRYKLQSLVQLSLGSQSLQPQFIPSCINSPWYAQAALCVVFSSNLCRLSLVFIPAPSYSNAVPTLGL